MRRAEVWWVEPPDEQPRPYVILTRHGAIRHLEKVIAAPVTRNARGIATEVQVGPDDGLRHESAVNLDNTALIHKAHLRNRITTLGPHKMHAICRALDLATSCA